MKSKNAINYLLIQYHYLLFTQFPFFPFQCEINWCSYFPLVIFKVIYFNFQGLELLSKHGITPHPDTIASKSKELGKNHDSQVLEWTKLISQAAEVRLCAENLKEELQGLNYLPSQPSLENFVEHVLGISSKEAKETESKGPMHDATVHDITTVDTSALNLCLSYHPGDTVTSVCNNLKTGGMSDNTLQETIKAAVSESAASQDKNDLKSAIDLVLYREQPKGYQIIGDNVDLHINVRHMSEQNKNRSLHTFNLVAMRDVVSGSNLPDKHIRTLNDVEISEFLPSHNDVEQLKKDFIVLWARVIVKNIPAFTFLKGVLIQHIQHQYSKEMQAITEEVTLNEIRIIYPRNLC